MSVVSIAPTQKRVRDVTEPDNVETENKKPRVATTPAETHMATETSVAAVKSETQAAVAAPVTQAEDVDIVELVSIFCCTCYSPVTCK